MNTLQLMPFANLQRKYQESIDHLDLSAEFKRKVYQSFDIHFSRLFHTLNRVLEAIDNHNNDDYHTRQFNGRLKQFPKIVSQGEIDEASIGTKNCNGLPLDVFLKRYFNPCKKSPREPAIDVGQCQHRLIANIRVYGDESDEDSFIIVLPHVDISTIFLYF